MTKTVTISALRADSTPYAHHDVIVTLVAGSAGGVVGSNVIVSQTKVPLNASGEGSIVLATNDVEITSPSTSFYRFTVEGSSPTITRSVRITDALPSTISWTRSGIEVGDPTIPQRDVSSDYVQVGDQSLTNYLASIDEAIDAGGGGGPAGAVVVPVVDGVADVAAAIAAGADTVVVSDESCTTILFPPAPTATTGTRFQLLVGFPVGSSFFTGQLVSMDDEITELAHVVPIYAEGVWLWELVPAYTSASSLGLGTAAAKNVPATGDASPTEVVQGDDSRLTDDRDPTSHDHAASEIVSGTVAAARLGSGTADSTTFLRGDSAWAAPPGGSPITEVRVPAVMFVGSTGQAVAPTVRSIGSSAVRSRLGIVMADSVSTSTWASIPWLPWTSVDVYLDMFNLNASTGGVRWQVYLGEQATTHTAMTAYLATIAVSSAASGDDLTYGTRWTAAVATSVAVTQSSFLSASVTRLGADAADTLAGSVYFAALRFRQAGT